MYYSIYLIEIRIYRLKAWKFIGKLPPGVLVDTTAIVADRYLYLSEFLIFQPCQKGWYRTLTQPFYKHALLF